MSKITYGLAECGSSDYQTILKMREEIMRKPIGLALSEKDMQDDHESAHVWLRVGSEIQATVKLVRENEHALRLRMVAVSPKFQGLGLGQLIVRFCEGYAAARGYVSIVFDARQNVEGFYLKLGYKTTGDVYESVGIPHVFMSKQINKYY